MAWRRHLLPKGLPLALAGGAIAAAVLLGVDSQQQARTQPPAAPPLVDYRGSEVQISEYDGSGALSQRLRSPQVEHRTGDDRLYMQSPASEMFEAGRRSWTLQADRGDMDAAGKELLLYDNVRARKLDDDSTIDTTRLRIEPDRKYAETDEPVIIVSPQGRTQAKGMRAFLDRDLVQLKSKVKGLYEAH